MELFHSQNPFDDGFGLNMSHLWKRWHYDGSPFARATAADLLFDLFRGCRIGPVFCSDFAISRTNNLNAGVVASEATVFCRDLRPVCAGACLRYRLRGLWRVEFDRPIS